MINIHYTDLAEKIKEVFVAQDTFILNKHFPEFRLNGKYFCDYLSMLIIEPQGKNPPIFYNTFSPFDIISQKAPDQAVIFQGGKMLLNVDFTDYISQRTGIMDAVVLKALGIKHIQEKQVLFIGTGKVASCSLIALKSIYPDMESVQYLNESGNVEKFAQTAEKLEITITKGDLEEIGKYDYIFCHARSIQPALPAIYKKAIKKGAVITSYAGENYVDVASEYYDSSEANILINWEEKLPPTNELQKSVDTKLADPKKFLVLKDLLMHKITPDPKAHYIIYRSDGTPMQNLAVLKLLLDKTSHH